MATALRLANYWWIALGIFAYLMVEVAAAIRWQVLLRVQGIRLSNMRVGGLFIIGMFYNQFMPGGTGGDMHGGDCETCAGTGIDPDDPDSPL